MMPLIGSILVLVSGTLIGFLQAARFAERPKQIRQLLHALQRLETEIGFGHTPLPAALRRSGASEAGAVGRLFADAASRLEDSQGRPFRSVWETAVGSAWPETSLRAPERDAILRLGPVLGISDREDQIKHLQLAMSQLRAEEETARADAARYGGMCRSLGILAAALVVILMI